MPATVNILSWHGVSGSKASTSLSDGQAVRFKAADNDTVDLNNKLQVPAAGSIYSYVKNLQFSASVTPSNLIDNLKVYSDFSNGMGTGVDILIKTSATYIDPVANAQTVVAGTASAFTYSSGSPLAVTGTLSNPSTGAFGDFVVMQMKVDSTASAGTTPSETITFSFDES